MKFQHIKELIELIDKKDITSVDIEKEGFKVSIKKEAMTLTEPSVYVERTIDTPHIEAKRPNNTKEDIKEEKQEADNAYIVKSPIVGTFYSAPSPDVSNYVKVGDKVKKGDTLCIIEAMKLMNEIEAEVSGEIIEILVQNEAVVEYGQPLFKIKE
jgi:acetyl-CoA carboxylase biotin carboxyl carrier protein